MCCVCITLIRIIRIKYTTTANIIRNETRIYICIYDGYDDVVVVVFVAVSNSH